MYARGKGALRRHKTTKSKGIGLSTRTAIATRFLCLDFFSEKVWIWFCWSVDWNPFFQWEVYFAHTIKEWWGISPRIAKSGTVRQINNPSPVGWDCELESLSGQTFHQDYYPQCPGSSRVVVSYWRNMHTLWTGRRDMPTDNALELCQPIYISLAHFLCDIGKQCRTRSDAALFA